MPGPPRPRRPPPRARGPCPEPRRAQRWRHREQPPEVRRDAEPYGRALDGTGLGQPDPGKHDRQVPLEPRPVQLARKHRAARRAARQMLFDRPRRDISERPRAIGYDKLPVHHRAPRRRATITGHASASRSSILARWQRDFTVPAGTPSSRPASTQVRPSRTVACKAARSSGESRASTSASGPCSIASRTTSSADATAGSAWAGPWRAARPRAPVRPPAAPREWP